MKSKKNNELDGKVSSLTERIGVSVIGLLTILGVGLIIYPMFEVYMLLLLLPYK